MDDHMYAVTMELVTERVNYHGANESKGLQDAFDVFKEAVDSLQQSPTTEQNALYLDCETYYGSVDGEQMRFYYEAGFSDAIKFIMGWREGWSRHIG